MPGHMALVGKAGILRRRSQGQPVPDQPAHQVQPAHHQIAVRAGSQAGAELAGQGEPVEACRRRQFHRADAGPQTGLQAVLRAPYCGPVDGTDCGRPGSAVHRGKSFGQGQQDPVPLKLVQRQVRFRKRGVDRRPDRSMAADRFADERQRPMAECLGDGVRVDIEDAIAEARSGPGPAVMAFVRMQHEDLARQAVPGGAAITEGLHPLQGCADRIAVVPVRSEGMAGEGCLGPFQTGSCWGDPQPVAGPGAGIPAARTFKTPSHALLHIFRHDDLYHHREYDPMPAAGAAGDPTACRQMSDTLPAFVLAGFALAGSPGPATLSLAATGAAFGARNGLGYMAGILLGMVVVMALSGTGIVGLLLALPGATPLVTALAIGYFVYLAWRIATAPPLAAGPQVGRRPTLAAGLLLSLVNPKGYAAMAALFTGFVLVPDRMAADLAAKCVLLVLIIATVNGGWLLAGAALTGMFRDPVANRAINLVFAVLLLLSVVVALLL